MADGDWKKRVGIEINYSSEDDERSQLEEASPTSAYSEECEEDLLDHLYSKTPPRTRIIRRNRSRKKKELEIAKSSTRTVQAGKNNAGSYHQDLIRLDVVDSEDDGSPNKEGKRLSSSSKRSMQLLRGSERDLKLDFSDIRVTSSSSTCVSRDGRVESMPQPAIKVESCNRFLSLTSKLVTCKNLVANCRTRHLLPTDEYVQHRVDFYDTFSKLIRMGNNDNIKRQVASVSQEEAMWQNELNDLIWLELQAWHADRTPQQQDQYLCQAREDVHNLLNEIMNYKFKKRIDQLSSSSSDSGIHFPPMEDDMKMLSEDCNCENDIKSCNSLGCLMLSCPHCFEDQNCALRDVEGMLNRLEAAEALYPSSRAFAAQYPLYLNEQFTARVKAMCLWYNMTKHHRLMLLILARQLLSYATRHNITDEMGDKDKTFSKLDVLEQENSGSEWSWLCKNLYNMEPVDQFNQYIQYFERGDTLRIYRKYIEDVLKVRGLRKALKFLEKIHTKILRKAKLTLEKPQDETGIVKECGLDDLEMGAEDELKRYGVWSEEAQALNLPSYRPAFLFISLIPLNVIHEYLQLRLETKPEKPSNMSIRQLTRELKDGLQLAVLNRQRYKAHIQAALWEPDNVTQEYMHKHLTSFDATVQNVLELYLDYLQQWVQMIQQERQQKNVLEEEWVFAMASSPHIPGGFALVGSSFCRMASSMMTAIGSQLKSRVSDLMEDIDSDYIEYNKQAILSACRELQCVCQETRDKALHVVALSKTLRKDLENDQDNKQTLLCNIIADSLAQLKREVLNLCEVLTNVILEMEKSLIVPDDLDEIEKQALQARYREVLHQFFKFGFEYLKEVCRLGTGAAKSQLCRELIVFAHHWMRFVKERCERGRGLRPRWANHGLDFLMTVCEPHLTNCLTDEEFEALKLSIDDCISHVIGTATPPTVTSPPCYVPPRSRNASPCPSPSQRARRPINTQNSLDTAYGTDRSGGSTADLNRELSWTPRNPQHLSRKISRSDRVTNAINDLDKTLEEKLRYQGLLGNVVAATPHRGRHFINPRSVNFSWQRGMKIGQGRFGKVYTAVNNQTGELMAVKEITLQPGDRSTIQNVALEIKIFEGIKHEHLVRYYGVEVHKDEMLIFMELCTQGTLESLVAATESGLPEALVRRYTHQLVQAIHTLHQHSIVHRDIKSANIFLTAEGNCLKLGDFGSAVKIKAHTTVPGELQGFVGTQAYMAPEVFMRTNTEGHGRAVDVWSLGCVLVEMGSGKRPWAEYDSNYQIMFKVGMGETPEIPGALSDEGAHFSSLCLQHDAKERSTTIQLLQHPFLRVDGDDDCLSCTMPSILEDYLNLGIKR